MKSASTNLIVNLTHLLHLYNQQRRLLILSPVKWAFKDSWYEHLMFTGNKQLCWFHYLKWLVLFVCLFVLIKLVFSLHVRLEPCNEKRLGHNAVNKIRAKWKIMGRCFSLQTNSFLFSVQFNFEFVLYFEDRWDK